MTLLGIDTGGTFTDFVLLGPDGLRVHKVLSTPDEPERAILRGIRDLGLDASGLRVVHGSTVATNAVLEGKGVRTAFVTSRGFSDLLSIGRQARERLYDLQPAPRTPPVPPELCLETGGRLTSSGEWLEPLTADELEKLRDRLRALTLGAVAVNLLFSYLDPSAERAIAASVPEGIHVSLSSDVLPEIREYERGMATWLNACVGPLVEGYLRRLGEALPGSCVSVMQSSGDTMSSAQAAGRAVRLLLSGPAGGLRGARFVAGLGGETRLLTFDMGGTSTDVALIDGDPRLTSEGRIAGYPVAVPMVDMHTIGAGGGSLAWLDAGGMLQVGPQSAGADPGPACYGRGGTRPTVTDANLVLGRLRPDAFLGGAMALDATAARRSLKGLASAMGGSVDDAAAGIVRLADEHMARALRVISVQRGVDARGHTLVSFGGAGGLHVCALAEALGLGSAMVPVHAGVLSALGMLATPPGRRLSRTRAGRLDRLAGADIEETFAALEAEGRAALRDEGVGDAGVLAVRTADLRYLGQSYTLEVGWIGQAASAEAFATAHQLRYGHRLDLPVELVNLRVAIAGPPLPLSLPSVPDGDPAPPTSRARLVGVEGEVPVYARAPLVRGQRIEGPAVVTEALATTWVAPGWVATADFVGNLCLSRAGWPREGPRV
jgi:N-methylhydantoinase A